MKPQSTPLFVKTHDFVLWLLQHSQRFPKSLRHSYTNRLESLAFEFEQSLLMANQLPGERWGYLEKADALLLCLRTLLRYAYDLKLISHQQLEYATGKLAEVGRLLGGWIKVTNRS